MDAIFSATALRDRPREVKEAARESIVRITENGCGAYVFCSEEVFRDELAKAREEAYYEARAAEAIERGMADYEAGRYVVGIEAGRAAVAEMRASRS